MALLRDFLLSGLLVLSLVVVAHAQVGNGLAAFVPFPGVPRCVLLAGLQPNKVLKYHPLGDIGATGTMRISVFQMQGKINLKFKVDSSLLSGPLPPRNITVFDSRSGGATGFPLFGVNGKWTSSPTTSTVALRTWILDAANKYPPGSTISYYNLVKQVDLSPRSFFGSITTERYKWGALRGTFQRGAVNMFSPVPLC
ncbi:hypothetical protein CLOM_g14168 [Closterium sp. NIES-68]|nr:hypothetical protein CLOM_g14168 [Closterium sp. NIES-68]GJP74185.1 hypothetical protein CLOP_g4811 [Closterium sp. NIES-67]GJP80586.1 hypothetical protein CLOP_g10788 [Closterium sp. NIES-67]